ncbi:sel1 repeat family protein [Variovorax paradoxus]|nr:sel1 repeat family protein [Variovorax paradoxus]
MRPALRKSEWRISWRISWRIGWRCAWVAAMVAIALASTPAPARDAALALTPEQRFALALEAQTEKDYRAMLGWLRSSAAAGFLPAQEMLGMALLGGPALFGNAVERRPCEALSWFVRAADQGSEIGRAHRNLLNRQPVGRRCASVERG